MNNLKICFLSNHLSGYIKLDFLLDKGLKIESLVTLTPDQANKFNVSGFFDFSDIAKKHNIETYYSEKFNLKGGNDIKYFMKNKFDILLISGWQRLVPAEILQTLKIGAIGEHGSSEYLPRGRGRSPINWSIINGRRRFVLHIFMADANVDSGKIIDKYIFRINSWDNIYTVYCKAALSSGKLLLKNIRKIRDKSWIPIKEAPIKSTYFSKRTEADDYISWGQSTIEIFNKIRGITKPYPGTKSKIKNSTITIWEAQPFDFEIDDFNACLGEILIVFPNNSFVVKTVDGELLVTNYHFDGKVKKGDILL